MELLVWGTTERKSGGRQRLTDAIVRRLPLPVTGKAITVDADVPGFGARITANGARSYVLRYTTRAGRERTYTIGDASVWRTTDARAEAERLRQIVDLGGDPQGAIEEERAAPTMLDLLERFRAEHLPKKRPGTARDYEYLLRLHVEPHFGQMKVAEVAFADVEALHHKITKAGSSYTANRAVAIVGKMFALAIKWQMRADNPARGIEKNREYPRRRYLKGDELPRLIAALAGHPDQDIADAIRMLLLTGARRGEVLAMRWADVDLKAGVWGKPPSSTKQREYHQVPLSAPALELLAKRPQVSEFVFPSHAACGHLVELKQSWQRLLKAAGIVDLRLHDVRHSYASQLASAGHSLPVIGALLGHAQPQTTARYAHLFDDPLRRATERVGAVITAAAGKTTDQVQAVGLSTDKRKQIALEIARNLKKRGLPSDAEKIEANIRAAEADPAALRDESHKHLEQIEQALRERLSIIEETEAARSKDQRDPATVHNKKRAAALSRERGVRAAELRQRGVPDPIAQAEKEIAEREGFSSGPAFNKWLRRRR